jgi:uncharacterized protein YkuJ
MHSNYSSRQSILEMKKEEKQDRNKRRTSLYQKVEYSSIDSLFMTNQEKELKNAMNFDSISLVNIREYQMVKDKKSKNRLGSHLLMSNASTLVSSSDALNSSGSFKPNIRISMNKSQFLHDSCTTGLPDLGGRISYPYNRDAIETFNQFLEETQVDIAETDFEIESVRSKLNYIEQLAHFPRSRQLFQIKKVFF